ncbi:MAG: S4 domain-containing protein, partial [Rubrobacteraceae bacterium]
MSGLAPKSFIVEPGEAEERLDRLASQRLNLSRSVVQRLIKNGRLLVNGEGCGSAYKVRVGERVEAQVPDDRLLSERIPVPIVFEDEHLLVVDKPAGLVVHPGAGNPSGTLVNALLDSGIAGGEDPVRPGVV